MSQSRVTNLSQAKTIVARFQKELIHLQKQQRILIDRLARAIDACAIERLKKQFYG